MHTPHSVTPRANRGDFVSPRRCTTLVSASSRPASRAANASRAPLRGSGCGSFGGARLGDLRLQRRTSLRPPAPAVLEIPNMGLGETREKSVTNVGSSRRREEKEEEYVQYE